MYCNIIKDQLQPTTIQLKINYTFSTLVLSFIRADYYINIRYCNDEVNDEHHEEINKLQ
jgi:hypothetical protein